MTLSRTPTFDLRKEGVNHDIDTDTLSVQHENAMMDINNNANEIQSQQPQETEQIIEINEKSKSNPSKLQQNYDYVVTRYYRKLINSDWDLWDAEDIVIWICNINLNEYQKYGDKLLKTMCKDNINGSYLREMNINDLHRFGIQNENDANYIYHEIQELIKIDTKHSLKGMVMEYMLKNQSLQIPIIRYKRANQERLSQTKRKKDQYKEELTRVQAKQCKIKRELSDKQNKLSVAENNNEQLKKKNVVLQGMLNTMKERYYQLLINSDWKLWNTQDIVIWIIKLNQNEYEKYGEQLLNNMNKEGIHGKSLTNLSMNDLHRFGIREAKDLDHIYTSLQKLLSMREEKKVDIDVNEEKDTKQHDKITATECLICMDRLKDHACIPCGHQCLCQQCKDKIDDKCPVCRKKYDFIIKIYQ